MKWGELKKGDFVEFITLDEKTAKMIKKKYKVTNIKQTKGGGRVIYMLEDKGAVKGAK